MKTEFNQRIGSIAEPCATETFEASKNFTHQMMSMKDTPTTGMKLRIEYMCNHTQQLTVSDVTYHSDTDKEYCLIDNDGCFLIVDKEEFIQFLPLRDEMAIAKAVQVNITVNQIVLWTNIKHEEAVKTVEKLQQLGMLPEIKLDGLK